MELSDEDFDRLERLARLKESGSITECEFADMKRQIVDEQPRHESAVQEFADKLLPTGEKLNRPARVTIFGGLRSTGYIETYGGDTRLLSGPSDPMKIYWAGHKIGKLKGFDTFSFDIESAGEVTVKSRGRTTQIFLGSHADSEVRFRTEDGDAVTAEVSYRRLG